jgi:hypothetical protein
MSVCKILPKGKRVWVISSIEARCEQLKMLHKFISDYYRAGDMLVYSGNIFGGVKGNVVDTIDEILGFRKRIMASFETNPDEICYLKGAYEDMLFKFFSLNFASSPSVKYNNMMESGLKSTINDYGLNHEEGKFASERGSVSLLRFIESLKSSIRKHNGHYELLFSNSLVNYAHTENKSILCLSAGYDKNKDLKDQKEELAYGINLEFLNDRPFEGYKTTVRGKAFEIVDDGIFVDPHYMTINPVDHIYAVLFDEDGNQEIAIKS